MKRFLIVLLLLSLCSIVNAEGRVYEFRITFDLATEAGITLSGFTIENFELTKIIIRSDGPLTQTKIDNIRQKLITLFNNKFGVSSFDVILETIY